MQQKKLNATARSMQPTESVGVLEDASISSGCLYVLRRGQVYDRLPLRRAGNGCPNASDKSLSGNKEITSKLAKHCVKHTNLVQEDSSSELALRTNAVFSIDPIPECNDPRHSRSNSLTIFYRVSLVTPGKSGKLSHRRRSRYRPCLSRKREAVSLKIRVS